MGSKVLVPAISPSAWMQSVADTVLEIERGGDPTVVVLTLVGEFDGERTAADDERTVETGPTNRPAVTTVTERLTAAEVEYVVEGRSFADDEADPIVAAATEHDVDRIYMYARRRSPAGKAVFGSILQEVVTAVTVPVVVVPSGST